MREPRTRRLTLVLFMAALLLPTPGRAADPKKATSATADEAPSDEDEAGKALPIIEVKVKVVHASKAAEPFMDEGLTALGEYLKESFLPLGYDKFEQLKEQSFDLAYKQWAEVPTPDGKQVKLRYKTMKDEYIVFWADFSFFQMKIKVFNGASFIQAGTKWNDGMLIYIISAKIK